MILQATRDFAQSDKVKAHRGSRMGWNS